MECCYFNYLFGYIGIVGLYSDIKVILGYLIGIHNDGGFKLESGIRIENIVANNGIMSTEHDKYSSE